jgi:hypothetical protein
MAPEKRVDGAAPVAARAAGAQGQLGQTITVEVTDGEVRAELFTRGAAHGCGRPAEARGVDEQVDRARPRRRRIGRRPAARPPPAGPSPGGAAELAELVARGKAQGEGGRPAGRRPGGKR